MAINSFRGQHEFLSNFYVFEYPISDDMRLDYITVENAYQAHKTVDRRERMRLRHLPPNKAKIEGHKLALRSDWDDIKIAVMLNFVMQKFLYNPELRRKLHATFGHDLSEGNHHNDRFWGRVNDVGENHLGKILMVVRKSFVEGAL